jgi:hypothetical protein
VSLKSRLLSILRILIQDIRGGGMEKNADGEMVAKSDQSKSRTNSYVRALANNMRYQVPVVIIVGRLGNASFITFKS